VAGRRRVPWLGEIAWEEVGGRIDPRYPQPADSLPGSRSSKYFPARNRERVNAVPGSRGRLPASLQIDEFGVTHQWAGEQPRAVFAGNDSRSDAFFQALGRSKSGFLGFSRSWTKVRRRRCG
jgi:hypothetical protein